MLRLEERSRLHQVLAKTVEDQGYPISAGGFRTSARSAHSSASQIRKLLESPGEVGVAEASDDERMRGAASDLASKARVIWGATRSIGLAALSVDAPS